VTSRNARKNSDASRVVCIRTAVAESVVRRAQAESQRTDLPTGEVEQARILRQPALRRAVVEMREFVDHRRQGRARDGSIDPGIRRARRHPVVQQRTFQQQAPGLRTPVDLLGQIVAPRHVDASIQDGCPCRR
jgi:hypothetical protein